jgi:hypothetical protein
MKNIFQIKWAAAFTFLEGIALLVFSIFVFISAVYSKLIESWATLISEVFLYMLLAVIITYVSKGFRDISKRFFTPFLLIQLFVLIVGWPLIEDNKIATKFCGILMVLMAIYSLVVGLLPANRKKFI